MRGCRTEQGSGDEQPLTLLTMIITFAVMGFGHTAVTRYTGTKFPLAGDSRVGQQQSPKVPLPKVSSSPAPPGGELRDRVEVGVSKQLSCSSPSPCPALPLPSWGLFEPHPSSLLDLEVSETDPAHKGSPRVASAAWPTHCTEYVCSLHWELCLPGTAQLQHPHILCLHSSPQEIIPPPSQALLGPLGTLA